MHFHSLGTGLLSSTQLQALLTFLYFTAHPWCCRRWWAAALCSNMQQHSGTQGLLTSCTAWTKYYLLPALPPHGVASVSASVSEAKDSSLSKGNDPFAAGKEAAAVLRLCAVLEGSRSATGRSCMLPMGLVWAPGHQRRQHGSERASLARQHCMGAAGTKISLSSKIIQHHRED